MSYRVLWISCSILLLLDLVLHFTLFFGGAHPSLVNGTIVLLSFLGFGFGYGLSRDARGRQSGAKKGKEKEDE